MKRTKQVRPPGPERKKGFRRYSAVPKPPSLEDERNNEINATLKELQGDGIDIPGLLQRLNSPSPKVDSAPRRPASPRPRQRTPAEREMDRIRKENHAKAEQIAAHAESVRIAENVRAEEIRQQEETVREEARKEENRLREAEAEAEAQTAAEYEQLVRERGPEELWHPQRGVFRNPKWEPKYHLRERRITEEVERMRALTGASIGAHKGDRKG